MNKEKTIRQIRQRIFDYAPEKQDKATRLIQKLKDRINPPRQAGTYNGPLRTFADVHKALLAGQSVRLVMRYHARTQSVTFRHEHHGQDRKADLKHAIACEKRDFADSATFYGGRKADCKYTFELATQN